MPASAVLLAKRALVSLLLRFAVAYAAIISINRDSSDAQVLGAFRKVILKVHPDKGGNEMIASLCRGPKKRGTRLGVVRQRARGTARDSQ